MGSVKVDLHSKERFYSDLTLSDIDVLQLLIEYRYKYDKYAGFESDATFDVAGDIADINAEMIVTYASIDMLIDQCKFSEDQLTIIRMIEEGYELKEISDELGWKHSKSARNRLNTILKDIAAMNLWNWRKVVYTHKLDLIDKECSKCKERLPAMPEFFREHTITKDGFQSQCKLCEK